MAITSGGKAYFTNVDGGGTFYCQFNPKELKLEDTASWKPSDEQGQSKPLLTYEKGQPAVLSMDLIFDTTDSGGSVQGRVDALRGFLAATVAEADEGGQSTRPPHVDFHWKSFTFRGVVEKISASVLMFKADGTPMRAKVSVTMKERSEPNGGNTGSGSSVTLSSAGSIFSGAGVAARTTTVQPNQTMTQAAAANKSDFRTIANANPQISDPMNIPAGTQLVVPANNALANVLANQALAQTPANFSPAGNVDPFGVNNDNGGFGNLGNLAPSNNEDLSADFSSSGLNAAVSSAADRAHQVTDSAFDRVDPVAERVGLGNQSTAAREEVHEAINEVEQRAHDLLGNPDFDFF
ncbi:MAG: LysM peptidoglycan-binding domain-containing protein [Myxococcales bacterium]|nr:LysM peptidoglycan-binding domain-containing protein [Myxococcales bacterium]